MAIKTALTFEEKVTAAYLHYAQGIDQHVIAMSMGVNMGRVNEACVAVRKALTPGSSPGNVTQLKEKRA